MEAEIIALSACYGELFLFPIIDMVCSLAEATNLPIGNMITNVPINEDDSGALVMAKILSPQFTPQNKYYANKTIWFHKEIFK
jgi:hypothetical protein